MANGHIDGSAEHPYNVKVANQQSALTPDELLAHPLWYWIKNRSEATLSPAHTSFIDRALCSEHEAYDKLPRDVGRFGTSAYHLLKLATEMFLLINCGTTRHSYRDQDWPQHPTPPAIMPPLKKDGSRHHIDDKAEDLRLDGVAKTYRDLQDALKKYLWDTEHSNYFETILRNVGEAEIAKVQDSSPFCGGIMLESIECPCLMELIWSYWHEEGMLVQTLTSIARRFQNMRGPNGHDPLAELELDFLRPLNHFLWGYIQDEFGRLSVVRRAYEYDHHYGLTLHGKAVPALRPADSRSKFLEAFHQLLNATAEFYRLDADTTVIADAFTLLNSLKEVHLLLAQGAHNQFRDLPWTARVEMLIQQWLLSRPEMQAFLRGRYSVPYPEPWMGAVDAMKHLQGWSDVSVRHFRDLAVFGERILLSIRYTNWTEINDQGTAKAWARFWKPEIQGYIHAYRAATGVDLAIKLVGAKVDATLPAVHLERRLLEQRQRLQLGQARQVARR